MKDGFSLLGRAAFLLLIVVLILLIGYFGWAWVETFNE